MATDKASAPAQGARGATPVETLPSGPSVGSGVNDQEANSAFMSEMLGDRGGYSLDAASKALVESPLLDSLMLGGEGEAPLEDVGKRGQAEESPPRAASPSETDEKDTDQDGQDDQHESDASPVEKSEDEDVTDSVLLTRDKDGKLKKLDLDDIEVPIELDGEQRHLSLADIQREFTDNRLRRDDYTRKMQEIGARVSKEVERNTSERQAELDKGYDRLKVLHGLIGDHLVQDVSYQDVLRAVGGDHEKAGAEIERLQRQKSAYQEAVKDMGKREAEATQQNVRRTLDSVRRAVPEWRDQRVFRRDLGRMEEFFRAEGLDDQHIVGIFQDPLFVQLARKAMSFDQLSRAKRRTAQKKTTLRLSKGKAPVSDEGRTGEPVKPRRTNRAQPDPWSRLNGDFQGLSQEQAIEDISRLLG